MNVYSIVRYRKNQESLVYIVKAEDSFQAMNFLRDHLHSVLQDRSTWLGSFAFYQKHFEVGLFDSYDPEILEVLSYRLYHLKY